MSSKVDDDDELDVLMSALFRLPLHPVYQASTMTFERVLDAIQGPGDAITRSYDRYHAATNAELGSDFLGYFTEKETRQPMQAEFLDELYDEHQGLGKARAQFFLDAVLDCQNQQDTVRVDMLKHAVRDYLCSNDDVRVAEKLDELRCSNEFSVQDVAKVIRLNQQHLRKHIDGWKAARKHDVSDDAVYFQRGFGANAPIPQQYQEPRWITSYSLSLTVSESFAKKMGRSPSYLLHAHWVDMMSRVLYFTPFLDDKIHSLEVEAAVVPFRRERPLLLVADGKDFIEFEILENPVR